METEKKIIGRCPLCGGSVVKTCKGYRCEHNIGDNPSCVLNINGIIGNRKMGDGEVAELLEKRRILLDGFATKEGKTFPTVLELADPKGWAASRKHGLTCLGNGIMGRTPKHRKIVLRGPTKKYGGNAASAAMRGKHPPTAGFAEAAVPSAQKSGAAQRAGWVVLLYLFKISKHRF